MKKTLFLHKDESLVYLIDRIENTKEDEIYLNIDENPELFSEFLNLKLLKREVASLGKNLTIVSGNSNVLSFIEQAGIDVAELSPNQPAGAGENVLSYQTANTEIKKDENIISDIKRPSFLERNKEPERKYEKINLDGEKLAIEQPQSQSSFNYNKDKSSASFFEKSIKSSEMGEATPLLARKRDIGSSIFKKPDLSALFQNKKNTYYILAALIVLVIGGIFVFKSKADLTVVLKKETIDFTFPAIADVSLSSIDAENNKIPGQIITLEKEVSGEFKATGTSSGATKASGTIAIYNEYNAESQQLVAKTRFQTSDGKIFRLTKKAIVPGAKMSGGKVASPGTVSADVEADQPGPDYNIGPSDLTIPGFSGTDKFKAFYAKSSAGMSGGSLGETRAVAKSDIENAKTELSNKLESEKKDYISSNTPNLVTLDASVSQKIDKFDAPKEGVAADNFTASLRVIYSVFAFDKKDVIALADSNLSAKIKGERRTYPETQVISYDGGVLDLAKSSFSFSVRSSEVVGGKLNNDELKSSLAGKDEVDIKKILTGNDAIESAEITLWPFWTSKAPANQERIFINIKE
ncbi:hypothetical protein HY249_02005 [Candidatus Azambacteria bacterium]|nr:hypothetical protein [Candidatus Azambacteria bacterium]